MLIPVTGSNFFPAIGAAPSAAVYARVERLMASQNTGAVRLNAALARDQTTLSALGQLQSALAGFQTFVQGLAGNGLDSSATVSGKGVQASASAKAVSGTYALDIAQLAQRQTLTSASQAGADTVIGTGAPALVRIEVGVTNGDSFSAGKTARSITIDGGNNTLQGIADALKGAGLDAQVVKSGTGFALSLSGQSGSANSLRISVAGDAAVKNLLAYDPAGVKNLRQTSVAQDALLKVDGVAVKSAGNLVNGAIGGVTLSLTGVGTSSVTVAQDAGQIAGNVAGLVDAYNSLYAKIQDLRKGDPNAGNALGQAGAQLAQVVRTGANAVALARAGIGVDRNGELQLDKSKLNAALATDAQALARLLTDNGKGLIEQLAAKVGALNGDSGAIHKEATTVSREITTLNSKKTVLAKALTAQATALVNLYAQQEKTATSNALPGFTGAASLFDFFA